ncbi:MAG TPA: hypothetical protein VGR73_08790 [Bryobacteraceae bacterium]|nr:hypothetical protein [Bryobacteraceae bacterium]
MVVETDAGAQVRRILESKAFRTSEVHRNLLNYLAEKSLSGDADSLKEYTVGLDVFSKPSSYDPRQESVVRMHMARLRQKVAEYYRTEGVDDPVIVDLPKGAFKVTFEPRPVPAEPEPPVAPIIPAPPRSSYKRELILAGLLTAAIAVASYFGLRLRQVEQSAEQTSRIAVPSAWTPELRELWAPLMAPDRPLVVCLATEMRPDAKSAPSLTGIATANGAFLLGQFLADRVQNVYVTGSDALTMPELTMGNLVYLGQPANRLVDALPADKQFVSDGDGVRNLHPGPGEPGLFADSTPSSPKGGMETYALITHAPGLSAKGDILYISGSHAFDVTAGVEAFTEPGLAKSLVTALRKPDGNLPKYYQIVMRVRSMDDTPVEIGYVTHRELSAARPAGRPH